MEGEVFEAAIKAGELYHSLQVEKNTKGYNWTVKVAGMDKEAVKAEIVELEKFCRDKFETKE
jgi:hypothetical protein